MVNIKPVGLSNLSREQLDLAKYIAEQKWVTPLREEVKENGVFQLEYDYYRGLCQGNHLFMEHLAKNYGLTSKDHKLKTMIKSCKKIETHEGVRTYHVGFNGKCFHSKDEKKCGCQRCPLGLASYFRYLMDEQKLDVLDIEYLYIEEDLQDIAKKVEQLKKEIETTIYEKEIQDEFQELLKLLYFNKWSQLKGLEPPKKPAIFYALETKDGRDPQPVIDLLNKMLKTLRFQTNSSPYELDLCLNLDKKYRCSDHRLTVFRGLNYLVENLSMRQGSQELTKYRNFQLMMEDLIEHQENYMVVIQGNASELHQWMTFSPKMETLFQKRLTLRDLTDGEIYDLFLEEVLKYDCELGIGFEEACQSYIQNNQEYSPYKNEVYAKHLFQQTLTNELLSNGQALQAVQVLRTESLPEVQALKRVNLEERLNGLVGMDEIKEALRTYQNYIQYLKRVRTQQPDLRSSLNLHMMLTGSPGTGKTTVARMVSQLLYDLGYLETNNCVEVEAKDLIAAYIGQTAIKTSQVIERALGGVLFIDEAYMLTKETNGNSFRDEAVATLIKAMEDQKDRLVVIFAGYEEEMKAFAQSNPGLISRIGTTFALKDYTLEELNEIAHLKLKDMGYRVTPKAKERMDEVLKEGMKIKHFGNGRFVMLMIQEMIFNLSNRIDTLTDETLLLITEEDLPLSIQHKLKQRLEQIYSTNQVSIGFLAQ